MKLKVYLATPYSAIDKRTGELDEGLMNARFEVVTRVAGALFKRGFHVFSPITHSAEMAKLCGMPATFPFWEDFDASMIRWADVVMVMGIDGVEESKGVKSEVEYARALDKTVLWLTHDEIEALEKSL